MFKSERYDDETLKHLHDIQLMMFKDLIKICEDNNIIYFVDGGTLLGAIRHKGFIPWDDDIDVIMFRKDFEKLDKIMQSKPNDKYKLCNVLNEETYFYTFCRLSLKDTLFVEWWADQVNYTPNIFIDIFILDNIPNNKIKRIIHKYSSFILNQMTMYAFIKFDNSSKIKKFIQITAHYLLKIIPISPYTIKRKCVNTFSKYKNDDCDQVCNFPAVAQMPVFDKKDWFPIKKAEFESIEVNIPNNYDKILTRLYGNYMELPPEKDRFRPAPEKIDFGEY